MNRSATPLPLRPLFTVGALALMFAMPAEVRAVTALKMDLTVGNNLSTVDRTYTYNLGATGMRGWIDNGWPETPAQDGYTAFAPYQILVTAVGAGTPASGILAVDDVILGASAGSGAVALFTSDARKSLGLVIGAAEAGNGILSFKRWRAGGTADVSIILPVMGAYSDTAPYNCAKTTLIRDDAEVFHGLSEYVIYAAKHTSMFGTAGHGFSNVPPPGGWEAGGTHGSISWYGPVNQAGLVAQLTIALGKKAGVVSEEIDPAIARAANVFGYYVNRGSIPYGEHQPYCGDYQIQGRTYYDHRSNGKDGLAAVMFACMDNKPVQTQYFSRMALAGFNGEAYGHTGQGFSYLWTMLGANMGGELAAQEYHKTMRWDRDMKRRSDGSFVYEGGEQWPPGKANDYFDGPDPYIYYDNPTAYYLLHACIPLKNLYITGKNATPANDLDEQAVSNATWAADFTAACGAYTKEQLFAALGEWDPIVRFNAATELATRPLTSTEVDALITMAENPADANQREAACTALGCLQATGAIPALTRRLKDTDIWVRAKAAKALTAMGTAAASSVPDMLDAFVANVKPTYPFEAGFNWNDPLQIANGYLSETLFNHLGSTTIHADKSLLYPAVRAGIKQPAGMWRGQLSDFVQNRLTLDDVKALTPELFEEVTLEGPCDRMFTMAGPYMALSALSKYHIAEGIDLCMGKTSFWGWDAAAAFDFLKPYDETARRMLPDLYAQDLAWMSATDPAGGENAANLDACIARIEAASTAPDLVYGLAVANPQIGVTPANTARTIYLTGSSCRQATVTCAITTQPLHGTLTGTPPNLTYTPAAGYQGMDRFTFKASDGLTTSAPATVHIVVGTGGTGLNGSYYDNMDFTSLMATRIDPSVNFDWGTAPPDTLNAGTYSVRWTGQVLAPESGTYRFSTRTSDGVRLWVNGAQVINDWNDQATSLWNDSAPITLTAGQKYSLKMEYYDNANPAAARLYWYMPSRKAATIIPQELLFPVTGVVLTSPSNGASFAPGATVTLTADVADVAGTVTNLSFYNGATLIGADTTAPYSVNWTNVATGEYALTAKATHNVGALSTSTVVVITVGGHAVPVTSGLASWFDSSHGVTADADQQVTFWHDRSGNGHDGVFELWDKPVVMRNQLFSKPAIRFSHKAAGFLDLAGTLFVKEQYVVVRSPSYDTWSSYGGFLCRRSGRGSSYLLRGTGFESLPAAVSKNGTPLGCPFNLGTITNYMVLKITVDNSDTSAAGYQIGRADGYSCEFDVTEIPGYSRALTSQEEAKVGGYLTSKYGLATAYPATGSLANRAATGITNSSAAINSTLMCNGTNYDVTAYWGPEDGGINPNNCANPAAIGSWTNVASIDINRTLTNLAPGTTYYFTFRATNATGTIWAAPAQSFTTLSTAKDILTFGTNVAGSSAVIDTGAGTVAWTVPYGTDLTNQTPAYTVSPLALGIPDSGISLNFSTTQSYTIVAEDFSTKVYTVTATLGAASPACDILAFGPGAAIAGNCIDLTVPYETDLATLAPAYTVSAGAVGVPASGVAPTPNFATANPAAYTITAQDGITTKTYWVTLTVLPLNPDRLSNGSFEIGKDIPLNWNGGLGGYTGVNLSSGPSNTDLPGWSGNFTGWYDINSAEYHSAQHGVRFINLIGATDANVLSQSFGVVAGTRYTVSYYEMYRGVSGRMNATLSVAAGTVSGANGSPVAVSAGPAASIVQTSATGNAAWTLHTFTFIPNTTTTATLSLGNWYTGVNNGAHGDNDGVFLDHVSVTAAAIDGTSASTTTLTRHPGTGSTSTYGTALSFDVTVTGGFGTPAGTATLKDGGTGGTTLGSATLTNGACTITTPTLAVGTHTNIVAVYGGNSTYATSTSGALTQTVNNPSITATAGANGTVSPAGVTVVNYNGSQSYAITPASGYVVGDVLVDGSSVGLKTSHVFSNITANHTIAASFVANPSAATGTYTVNQIDNKVIYKFTGNGTFTPASGLTADILVVGGGGSGGGKATTSTYWGGGGGAGGLIAQNNIPLIAQQYAITVGDGGAGGTSGAKGGSGTNSVFGSLYTAMGGGGGGSGATTSGANTGAAGGSTGGGGRTSSNGAAGTPATAGQGTLGVAAASGRGGGGGAGAVASAQNGGAGINSSISGSSTGYAGGGGAGGATAGTASHGGGAGIISGTPGTAGTANTGGGGGGVGSTSGTGGAGGSGIVIVSYTIKAPSTITFDALPAKTLGDPPFHLTATATSGLPVSYASSDPAVASVNGSLVTLLLAGTTTITASQPGDGNHNPANPVPQTLTVNPAPLSAFAAWAADTAQGLTAGVNDGPMDDPYHDGILNLLEFTLGGNPLESSRAILPKLTKPAGDWFFEYKRSVLSKSSTTQTVEYGSDLTGRAPLTVPPASAGMVTITPGTTSDHVKVTLPPLGASGFVRLKVSQ